METEVLKIGQRVTFDEGLLKALDKYKSMIPTTPHPELSSVADRPAPLEIIRRMEGMRKTGIIGDAQDLASYNTIYHFAYGFSSGSSTR